MTKANDLQSRSRACKSKKIFEEYYEDLLTTSNYLR